MHEILEEAGVATLLGIPEVWDREVDIIVVGFGGAGAAAAIEAHDAGADVLILEKAPLPGGTTAVSGGGIYCGGTSLQKELGIEDSTEEVYKFYMAVANFEGKLRAAPQLIKIVAEQGPVTFEWCKGLGISFPARLWEVSPHFHAARPGLTMTGNELYPDFASKTSPNYRSHWCDGGGPTFFGRLEAAVRQREIKCMFDTAAHSLIANSKGEVCGILAEGRQKKIYIRSRKAVILTAGGHGYNKWLANGLARSLACIENPVPGRPAIVLANTGDGITMALALGADYWAIDGGTARPVAFIPSPFFFDRLWCQPRVYVNKYGKRYVNEDWYMSMQAVCLEKQDDMIGWAIIDDKVATALDKELIVERVGAGRIIRASSIEDLAKTIGVDSKGLKETISTWNANVAKGKDPGWDRKWGLEPIVAAPFYATKVVLGEGNESTGVKINANAQVIHATGKPIPRLYAAGRTSGGQFGLYPGCGTSIMTCLIFGRIAGKNATAETLLES